VKVGDLVRFKSPGREFGPFGIVLSFKDLPESPHPSQPERDAAYIEWACKYTAAGNYQLSILEVASES